MRFNLLIAFVLLVAQCGAMSPAVSNVVDAGAAGRLYADYTNNVLRVAALGPKEALPANMPFQLVVGPDPADRTAAETAITTVASSMPRHVHTFFSNLKLMAPVTQWIFHRSRPGVTNDTSYLTKTSRGFPWQAADFNLPAIAKAARNWTSNDIPILACLHPVYEEFKPAPITRAVPFVDYPDPRSEAAYEFPCGALIVLRAPELSRKFRFRATGWPLNNANITFKWMPVASGGGYRYGVGPFLGRGKEYPLERGYGEMTLVWKSFNGRVDYLVFARYGDGAWGPPSVVSFIKVPNEKRTYGPRDRLERIEYQESAPALPQLCSRKRWKDEFTYNSLGQLIGFIRTRSGRFRGESFSPSGELILETYASEQPKISQKVRYFAPPDDPLTLDYEILPDEIRHADMPVSFRNRGEFFIK